MDKPKLDPKTKAMLSTKQGQDLLREAMAGKPLSETSQKSMDSLRQKPIQQPSEELPSTD